MVYTGVAVVDAKTEEILVHFVDGTKVSMYSMTEEWIRSYIETGEPMDKAGAYGIQGYGSMLVEGISGDHYNVIGLPVCRLAKILIRFGVDPLALAAEKEQRT